MNIELTFLRHGESLGNAEGRLQGQTDFPLTARGREQAAALASRWKAEGRRFDHVVCSPLLRARQTAAPIAEALELTVEFNHAWMERSFGVFENQLLHEVRKNVPPDELYHLYTPPGNLGESLMDVYTRACHAVQNLLDCNPGRYLIVSHGLFLNMVLYVILGLDAQNYQHGPRFRFGNTAYLNAAYDLAQKKWLVFGFNNQKDWFED